MKAYDGDRVNHSFTDGKIACEPVDQVYDERYYDNDYGQRP